jgi:hypothetical protein
LKVRAIIIFASGSHELRSSGRESAHSKPGEVRADLRRLPHLPKNHEKREFLPAQIEKWPHGNGNRPHKLKARLRLEIATGGTSA